MASGLDDSQQECPRVHAGVDPRNPAPRKSLPWAYLHASRSAGEGFSASRRRLAAGTCKPPARPPLSPARADPPALAHPHTCSPSNFPAPTPTLERTGCGGTGSGAVRSRREQRGGGRWRGGSKRSRFVTGAPPGGKTTQTDERGPGTTVPRHETGRPHLGAVPSGDGPCLAGCLETNGRW